MMARFRNRAICFSNRLRLRVLPQLFGIYYPQNTIDKNQRVNPIILSGNYFRPLIILLILFRNIK
jgi:hypothetical protein